MNEWNNYPDVGPNDDWTIAIDFWVSIKLMAEEDDDTDVVLKLCEIALWSLRAPAAQGACERGMNPIKKNHTKQRNRLGKERLVEMIYCELSEKWSNNFK